VLALVHPDDEARMQAHVAAAKAGRDADDIEFRIVRRSDGAVRWVWFSARSFFENGVLVRRLGVAEDITERKEAEARLRESEENYRYTVELSPQLPWTAEGDGSNLEFKREFADFFNDPERGDASAWTDRRTHPDDLAYRRREWEFSLRSGRPYDVEFRVRLGDGEYHWVRSRGYPRRDESGRIVKWYGIVENVHAQRLAEQQLQKLQSELSQVARVSAMGTLASTLAHELNQPLTAVANYLAGSKRLLMNHGASATAVIAEALENASKAAVQAGEIVRRLRDLVSRGEVNAQRVELAGLIHEACELTFGDVRDRSIELSLEFGPDTRTVLADRIQLQQVLVNLLRNAAEAMAGSPTRVITLSAMAAGAEQVTVRVEDSGPGVSPEVKRHLFSPFVTTKESGMGVGLSICRSIVEAHGGQLWVEDASSGGAAFCFTLHRALASA
jgi:two-component system, LuxR family, sensor kinase FixL